MNITTYSNSSKAIFFSRDEYESFVRMTNRTVNMTDCKKLIGDDAHTFLCFLIDQIEADKLPLVRVGEPCPDEPHRHTSSLHETECEIRRENL